MLCSHITASLHLAALEAKVPFIPADKIAPKLGVEIEYEVDDAPLKNMLIPDNLIGLLRYHPIEAAWAHEVGRPGINQTNPDDALIQFKKRKSLRRMFIMYRELIEREQLEDLEGNSVEKGTKLYNLAYRVPLKKPLMPIYYTTKEADGPHGEHHPRRDGRERMRLVPHSSP